jgi:hypothetical protein
MNKLYHCPSWQSVREYPEIRPCSQMILNACSAATISFWKRYIILPDYGELYKNNYNSTIECDKKNPLSEEEYNPLIPYMNEGHVCNVSSTRYRQLRPREAWHNAWMQRTNSRNLICLIEPNHRCYIHIQLLQREKYWDWYSLSSVVSSSNGKRSHIVARLTDGHIDT